MLVVCRATTASSGALEQMDACRRPSLPVWCYGLPVLTFVFVSGARLLGVQAAVPEQVVALFATIDRDGDGTINIGGTTNRKHRALGAMS